MGSARHSLSRTTVAGLAIVLSALIMAPVAAGPVTRALTTSAGPHGLDPGLGLLGDTPESVIVTGTPGVVTAVARHLGRVPATLPIIGGVAAAVPAAQLRALAAEPAVASITADRAARF